MSLSWCEECQSHHTKEFGDEFHGRILNPRVAQAAEKLDAEYSGKQVDDRKRAAGLGPGSRPARLRAVLDEDQGIAP